MDAMGTIHAYYEALRRGEPLPPYFHAEDELVKFSISERLDGSAAVRMGLREQTRQTDDWTVESRDLRVTERDCHAWFTDEVSLSWQDEDFGTRRAFETRWSGTLEHREEWRFVGLHVSVAQPLE